MYVYILTRLDHLAVMLSGDISFSYKPMIGDVRTHQKHYERKLKRLIEQERTNKWVVIFSRKNNFGPEKGVYIDDRTVHVHTMNGEHRQYSLDLVVFASSSDIEDHEHMVSYVSTSLFYS